MFFITSMHGQNVYKTPSGRKYHVSSCRMVENVSKKVEVQAKEIFTYKLTACKICKPPKKNNLTTNFRTKNKAVGTSISVRCKGLTKKGSRCKHVTRIANGYCYQHTKKNNKPSGLQKESFICGARTKSGRSCRRKAKNRGYCYQHR